MICLRGIEEEDVKKKKCEVLRDTVRARTPAFALTGIRMVIMLYGCKRGLE